MAQNEPAPVFETVRAHETRLKAYARRRGADGHEAEDLFQEMVLRLLQRARRAPLLNPLAYAFRVLDNLMRDRRQGPSFEALDEGEPCEQPGPGALLEGRELAEAFSRAIAAMPRLRREVYLRRRLEGQGYDRIAQDLRLTPEAVQKHYSRASATLRKVHQDGFSARGEG
ncbi:sigma-70 family RNA polymerase sigma factor [Caulobacter segnis]|jgi:RNA polymerase sigma factor (sigma-70 family)|uniref:RNA polymerase, sigma-24 subunit, ECF subfamily n=2 Tax=Caulobacter segnis TaxID=88688 RepID=D5VHM9_CAUST|nr:sigma-70 family RNA polymerase sigma factor [Caulobacter segnis]ADG09010.1 RNA polymerase, sigma-24 subunit, ECF subfamily [Caulobacter segnis ATCC 21756]AVQ00841.1 sigma-70 family RNA polymerase sigma factor [Caulobacter segnis]